ncbi:hypothetical protein QTP88_024185 [Uroleucon formosanum]
MGKHHKTRALKPGSLLCVSCCIQKLNSTHSRKGFLHGRPWSVNTIWYCDYSGRPKCGKGARRDGRGSREPGFMVVTDNGGRVVIEGNRASSLRRLKSNRPGKSQPHYDFDRIPPLPTNHHNRSPIRSRAQSFLNTLGPADRI